MQIPSTLMIVIIPEVSEHGTQCSDISQIFGTAAILSLQFAVILIIADFIITNKQVISK